MEKSEKLKRARTIKTISPGQPGTNKLMKKYGNRLVAVRYRHDQQRNIRYKTIEIIVDKKPDDVDKYFQHLSKQPLNNWPLSNRTRNVLNSAHIIYLDELLSKTKNELRELKGMGKESLDEIEAFLSLFGLSLKGQPLIPHILKPPKKINQRNLKITVEWLSAEPLDIKKTHAQTEPIRQRYGLTREGCRQIVSFVLDLAGRWAGRAKASLPEAREDKDFWIAKIKEMGDQYGIEV